MTRDEDKAMIAEGRATSEEKRRTKTKLHEDKATIIPTFDGRNVDADSDLPMYLDRTGDTAARLPQNAPNIPGRRSLSRQLLHP